jgi:hypothetical protein
VPVAAELEERALRVAGPADVRALADLLLRAKIEAIHRRSKGVYGSPNRPWAMPNYGANSTGSECTTKGNTNRTTRTKSSMILDIKLYRSLDVHHRVIMF